MAGKSADPENDEAFVKRMMDELRNIRSANGKVVQYSQGQHDLINAGFMMAFGGLHVLRGLITDLQKRLATIEQKGLESPLQYRGVWKPGTYPKGSFVTHGGSVFHADGTTDFKPGEGGGWTLAVKAGRDGKPA